nr:MAG TPA: hypothetical protein [Caudoviricetes sp.]
MSQVTHLYNSKFLYSLRAPSTDLVLGALIPHFHHLAKSPKIFSIYYKNIYFFFTINKRKKWVFGHSTPQTRIKPRFFAGQKHFQKWAETHFFWPFDQNSPKSAPKICIKNDQNPQKVGNWPKIFIKVGRDF